MPSDTPVTPDAPTPVERRLATILIADVFGYSRMMGEDEERTIRILRGHRTVFDEMLKSHRGRVFNTAGDAILAEFPSAVEAVRCATEIQAALRTRNEHLPEDQRMWFRIGINLGDVMVQDGDLLGDGVNVAARIQTIADPGGICISGSVYDQIQNKLSLQFKLLGERTFKNISQPVRTFSISDEAGGTRMAPRVPDASKSPLVAVGILAALVAIGGGGYWFYRDYAQRGAEQARVADEATRKAAADKEAKLAAELQAAKDALAQAEASKQKAETDRTAAETAQREAKLESELRAAKDALQKASVGKSTPAEAKAADGSAKGAAVPGVDRFDGIYAGRLCKTIKDGSFRCWTVSMTAQHGALAATWSYRLLQAKGHATGTITADGHVKIEVDGLNGDRTPLKGTFTGSLANNVITLSGALDDGTTGNATLTWAPDRPPPSAAANATNHTDAPRRAQKSNPE